MSSIARECETLVDKFLMDVKRHHFRGTKECSPSTQVAVHAVKVLRDILTKLKSDATIRDVLATLRKYGKELAKAGRYGPMIANVVRRILWIVRDEYNKYLLSPPGELTPNGEDGPAVLSASQSAFTIPSPYVRPADMLLDDAAQIANPVPGLGALELGPSHTSGGPDPEESALKWYQVKTVVLRGISEYVDEFDNTQEALCKQADQHVREGEVILTYGHSATIETFLVRAAERRKFTVIVAQSSPFTTGQTMTKNLKARDSKENIDVKLVADASIFAMMSDVGKVIIGTQYVLANGGVIAEAGTKGIALAAKHYNVPVLVIAASEKFCPYFPVDRQCSALVKLMDVSDQPWTNEGNPHMVRPFAEAGKHGVHVVNAVSDYIEPDFLTLFISNEDTFASSYVYRLISESYNPEDADI